MKNICKYCTKQFESKTSTKRYCSIKCQNDDRKIIITKNELFENYYNFFLCEYEKTKPLTDKLINIINEHNKYLNNAK